MSQLPRSRAAAAPAAGSRVGYRLRDLPGDLRALRGGRGSAAATLDPVLREEIMLAVARQNACRFCVFTHEALATAAGLSQHRSTDGTAGSVAERRASAVDYALALVATDSPDRRRARDAALRCHGEAGIRAIERLSRLTAIGSRAGNSVDALRARLHGQVQPNSPLVDELVVSVLAAIVAPVVLARIAQVQGRSPLKVWRDFAAVARSR